MILLKLHSAKPTANQIAVLFDHQYVWKELIDILGFLHGDLSSKKGSIWD